MIVKKTSVTGIKMKLHHSGLKGIICLLLCFLLLPLGRVSEAETGRRPWNIGVSSKKQKDVERFVSIDFNDVDINVFIAPISIS